MSSNISAKQFEEFLTKRRTEPRFLYNCPHCKDPVYEGDEVTAVEGFTYCPECAKPMLPECKSFNCFLVKRAPTNEELFEMICTEELE